MFVGSIEKHEQVVLHNPKTGDLVDARAKFDQTLRLGDFALFDVDIIRGLPVDSATVNVNVWDVYTRETSGLLDLLLDRIFKKEEA